MRFSVCNHILREALPPKFPQQFPRHTIINLDCPKCNLRVAVRSMLSVLPVLCVCAACAVPSRSIVTIIIKTFSVSELHVHCAHHYNGGFRVHGKLMCYKRLALSTSFPVPEKCCVQHKKKIHH